MTPRLPVRVYEGPPAAVASLTWFPGLSTFAPPPTPLQPLSGRGPHPACFCLRVFAVALPSTWDTLPLMDFCSCLRPHKRHLSTEKYSQTALWTSSPTPTTLHPTTLLFVYSIVFLAVLVEAKMENHPEPPPPLGPSQFLLETSIATWSTAWSPLPLVLSCSLFGKATKTPDSFNIYLSQATWMMPKNIQHGLPISMGAKCSGRNQSEIRVGRRL